MVPFLFSPAPVEPVFNAATLVGWMMKDEFNTSQTGFVLNLSNESRTVGLVGLGGGAFRAEQLFPVQLEDSQIQGLPEDRLGHQTQLVNETSSTVVIRPLSILTLRRM